MSDEDIDSFGGDVSASEDEDSGNDRKHTQLVDSISALDGKKQKLGERTVPSTQISEYHFGSVSDGDKVQLKELLGSLKTSAKKGEVKKQLRSVAATNVESVPLPKHQKQQIERTVAYETTSEEVSKWDPVVQQNRQADQIIYPLERQEIRVVTTEQFVKRFTPRTPLEIQVAALLQGSENIPQPNKELTVAEERALQAMDLEEAKERRLELMKHRALMSYKESKAKWHKKIKSKRFHRILKKEKQKAEKNQLDNLQKSDPELFAERIKELEKDRIEERMSLKHRGGSKYAQKKMIYAKYDDKARKEVQDMLQRSRELTQKISADDIIDNSDDSEGGVSLDSEDEAQMIESEKMTSASNNPWMNMTGRARVQEKIATKDVSVDEPDKMFSRPGEVVNRELDHNADNIDNEDDICDNRDTTVDVSTSDNVKGDASAEIEDIFEKGTELKEKQERRKKAKLAKKNAMKKKALREKKMKENKSNKKTIKSKLAESGVDNGSKAKKKKKKKKVVKEDETKSISETTKQKTKKSKKKKSKNSSKETSSAIEVKFNSNSHSDGDDDANEAEEESLITESLSRKRTLDDIGDLCNDTDEDETVSKKRRAIVQKGTDESNTSLKSKEEYIDPNKMFTLQSKITRKTKAADILDESDNDDDDDNNKDVDQEELQRMTIAEAFADDDVIEEFSREKREIIESEKPKDIDLTLPGWGQWGGTGIVTKPKKRMIIKAPRGKKRADIKMGHVIKNERKSVKFAKHQVKTLPFPYMNPQQFEQSIRAPIGNTWNPETAVKELTKPKVITKMGKVIDPISKANTFKGNQKQKTEMDFKGKDRENEDDETKIRKAVEAQERKDKLKKK